MAGGGEGATPARELDQTPTWAVAVVCAVIVVISIILEKVLHMVGEVIILKLMNEKYIFFNLFLSLSLSLSLSLVLDLV
jgi:hypothetical protein